MAEATKRLLEKTPVFVNALFPVYVGRDNRVHSGRRHRKDKTRIEECGIIRHLAKPDVYLIVLDEYFGSQGLREYFGFDNSKFE